MKVLKTRSEVESNRRAVAKKMAVAINGRRLATGLSIKELANKSGVDEQTIISIEGGTCIKRNGYTILRLMIALEPLPVINAAKNTGAGKSWEDETSGEIIEIFSRLEKPNQKILKNVIEVLGNNLVLSQQPKALVISKA